MTVLLNDARGDNGETATGDRAAARRVSHAALADGVRLTGRELAGRFGCTERRGCDRNRCYQSG
ncbi:hypothetical protein PWG71_27870 [Nocardiopsis sp. N85]|uniref:hypothetical protein n=1 Tax=Nocardiopsis sp. N85 TaxID=3029400 RepID=UPI00237F43A1|nr:hypothetical protein [Nocardiopsis sp. N85]MDE3725216.1 hypothetical protein [Nocardiopsis sp. N85]